MGDEDCLEMENYSPLSSPSPSESLKFSLVANHQVAEPGGNSVAGCLITWAQV